MARFWVVPHWTKIKEPKLLNLTPTDHNRTEQNSSTCLHFFSQNNSVFSATTIIRLVMVIGLAGVLFGL